MRASFSLPKNEIKSTFKMPTKGIKATFSIDKVVHIEDLDFATNERVNEVVNEFTNDIDIIATELENRYTKIEVDRSLNTLRVESEAKYGLKEDVLLNKNQIGVILDTIEDDKRIIEHNFETISTELEQKQAKGDYALKSDIPIIPTVPTKTSQLINDSNFLTQHQDISGKQDVISDLAIIRNGASKGETALQSFTETDPVYLADKPYIALKSDIPDVSNLATNTRVNEVEGKIPSISGLAKDSDVIHKANAETITGIKTFNGGKVSSGAQPSIIATNGFTAGGYNVTGWADISCHRLCNNQINTGSYYMNSDGSVIFRHKTGTALAEGSANDAVLMLHPVTGITAGWSGKAGTATTTGNVLVTDFNVQKGIATSVANASGGEVSLTKAMSSNNYVVHITPRAIGNYFVSCSIVNTQKFNVRISDYYGNPVAVSFSWVAIEN